MIEPIVAAEAVLPCRDLDEMLAFFVDQLGFRLEMISPADDPSTAVLSAAGTRVRLVRGAVGDAGTIRLATDGGSPRELVAPNGTLVQLVPSRTTFLLPALAHRSRSAVTPTTTHGSSGGPACAIATSFPVGRAVASSPRTS
jgi:catechol 2,3-dioxygenase-like lactoylglutathione lyase family enzyme